MESDHLTTRTYTAPTCTLIVASKEAQRLRSGSLSTPVDFVLELNRSELGDLDRLTLQGQPQQLDTLHQSITSYIADLVAKFPHSMAERHNNLTVDGAEPSEGQPAPSSQLDPRVDSGSPRSGIIKNLPGLRGSIPPSPSEANSNSANLEDDKPSISNLLGRWGQSNRPDPRADDRRVPTEPAANMESHATHSPTPPYPIAAGDRSLDHYLYLGDLATPTSTEKLSVSALQLFDLAAVLDEYAAEHVTTPAQPNVFSRTARDRPPEMSGTDSARSRLPNLPRIPPQMTEVGQAYYRAPRSRSSSFMSGIPWAIAAAIAVGAPLLLLDPNPNFLKDATSKFKKPAVTGTKTTTVVTAPGATPPNENGTDGLPTPWQQQPVEPPVSPKLPSATTAPTPGKLGTAPLSESLLGAAQVPATPGTPGGTANPAIAPNPLATASIPGAIVNPPSTTITPTPTSGTKPTPVKKTPTPTQTAKIGQLPIDPSAPGKVSLATQPILTPPIGQPTVIDPPKTPIPFDRSGLDESGRIDPAARQNPKKTAQKVKPKPTFKPNPTTTPVDAGVTTPPTFEPLTPVPTNPNLVDPNQNSTASPDPQVPPIVPNQPLQPSAANSGPDPADSPSLQESKRFFQGKWKASTTQTSALQYVIQVGAKSGTVRSVTPQGTPATTYLQQTQFIKPGQKLLSPAAAGDSDQKIRVLLQPDGNVDTFIEP